MNSMEDEKYKVGVGGVVATEFGIGEVIAMSKTFVIVKIFTNNMEVAIDRFDAIASVPAEPINSLKGNESIPRFDVGDFVYVDDDVSGKVVVITKDWTIIENRVGESAISNDDSSFYLSHNVEFVD
jgi:hypothetical protein